MTAAVGTPVDRRSDADPRAVLMVEIQEAA